MNQNSKLTNKDGETQFEALRPGNYTFKIYYGDKYDKSVFIKEMNFSIQDDMNLSIEHINITKMDRVKIFTSPA